MNKLPRLVAIFAVAVLAGCSSPSPDSSPMTAKRLTGTMDDWANAVCDGRTPPMPMEHGRILGGATIPMVCHALMQGNGVRIPMPISIGTYTSESLMENDFRSLGAYAEGNDGTEYVVFASISTLSSQVLAAESAMLQPLQNYGFTLHPSPNSLVEPPAPMPDNTNAMPIPTAVPPAPSNASQIPPDADSEGFVGSPGARCNYTNPAVAIGRTSESLVVICQTSDGRFYYKGFGLHNGLSVEIDGLVRAGSGFIATNNGVQYSLSRDGLIITEGSAVVLSSEPMLEYWSGQGQASFR